jgi:hypothetical protein
MEGKKKVLVPELITMTKVLFDRYRLDMYTYLNTVCAQEVWPIMLEGMSKPVLINHESAPSRRHLLADRQSKLLRRCDGGTEAATCAGAVDWRGCLTCWCGFDDNGLFISIEDLSDQWTER